MNLKKQLYHDDTGNNYYFSTGDTVTNLREMYFVTDRDTGLAELGVTLDVIKFTGDIEKDYKTICQNSPYGKFLFEKLEGGKRTRKRRKRFKL